MTIEKRVLEYLKVEPRFRERKNKNRGIVNLLCRQYPEIAAIPRDTLISVIMDAASYDRQWRKLLAENESLRGSDYGDKKVLEDEKMVELGYQPGIEQTNKLINKL